MGTIQRRELELLLSKNVFGNRGIGVIPGIYARESLDRFELILIRSAVIVGVGFKSRPWGFYTQQPGLLLVKRRQHLICSASCRL